jgi:branched-chain amino acid transport system ATP-binding protein
MALEVDGACVSYGRIQAVRDASLGVADGEFVCVLGRNGAGKSSLLRAVAGFEPVQSGRVLWDGADITRVPPHRRVGMGIAFVMDGRRVFRTATVIENLRLGSYIHRRDRRRISTSLERVTALFPVLAAKSAMQAATLSGGEQQMLLIGQALMAAPRLLLLDEPSAGLAPKLVADLFRALGALRVDGMQVLIVEQFVRQALALADRGYVLDNGQMVLDGSTEELLGSPSVADIYIGRPTAAGDPPPGRCGG